MPKFAIGSRADLERMRHKLAVADRKIRLMAVVMASIPLVSHSAPTAVLPQAAEFYVGGLEPVYADMFTVFSLSVFCTAPRLYFSSIPDGEARAVR
jgi:hypothetical protein